MPKPTQLTADQILPLLDDWFEVEFTFRNTDVLAAALALMSAGDQAFVLDWTRRIASTHVEIAFQFVEQSTRALSLMDGRMIEAWVLHAMDIYDRSGLYSGLKVIREIDLFVRQGRERASGCVFEEEVGVLLPFVQGLSGRKLKVEQGDHTFTDSEVIFLPAVMAHLPDKQENFKLYKAAVAHLWAQARFGTFRVDLEQYIAAHPTPDLALRCFHALESVRLDACIARELPGLFREMGELREKLDDADLPDGWSSVTAELTRREATAADSLRLVDKV
ncbi:MAG: nitric oxide reductase activation protein, partial [gamma proteobacterium endosymbiont of Lamellibrachia anaximandri]|nr:nitric oxide reductase activation protein [gamma proteobacterium endosymbiont of Lamellibrachia anaximandri]